MTQEDNGRAIARILIVEDNEMNRDMLRRRLMRKGYDLVFAVDGASAIAKAQSDCPDLILMDIGLGKDDGLDVTRHIRAHGFGKDVPIVALTAHVMASDRDKCLLAGCTNFETKPVEFDRLMEKITKSLSTAAART